MSAPEQPQDLHTAVEQLWTFLQRAGQNLAGNYAIMDEEKPTKVWFLFSEFPARAAHKPLKELVQSFLSTQGWKATKIQLFRPHLVFFVSKA